MLSGDSVALRGKVRPSGAHRVKVVFGGPAHETLAVRTKSNGTFRVKWDAGEIGNYSVTAYGVHDARVRGSHSPARHLTSYRLAGASYYGPGLYGNGVACGGTLEPGTLGVANKTLPCGTMVKLRYGHNSITVPVIDRGPYVAGREYDLTEATKDASASRVSATCWPTTRRRASHATEHRPRQPGRASRSCGSSSSAAASASPSKEARRTPSSRTGRGGS